MTYVNKILLGGAGFAALAAAAPASAQYYGNPYYGNQYAYASTNAAAQRCAAAVQNRLARRGSNGILGAIFGVNTYASGYGRVLSVTRVTPTANSVRVRGIASSGRMAYNPYGMGAYGMLGSNYSTAADLSFKCDVDYRGFIRDVDITRRY
jgi:hypothetical protein